MRARPANTNLRFGSKGMKRHLIRTFSLTAVLALLLSAMSAIFLCVGAVDNTSIFYSTNAENTTENGGYLTYLLDEDSDSVTFRRNLALKWFAPAGEDSLDKTQEYFTLSLGFVNTDFESFSVALQTSQFSMSKEGKTTNTLTFTKNDSDGFTVSVNGNDTTTALTASQMESFTLSLGDDDTYGSFGVYIDGSLLTAANAEESVRFTNIGQYYARYASATATTPITPLTFSATGIGENGAEFNIRSLNGQEMQTDAEGAIADTTAPVLVVNSDIRQIYFGTEIDFDTVSIDVCTSSGITTDEYYYYESLGATVDEDNADATLVYGGKTYAELASDTWFSPEDFDENEAPQVSFAYRVKEGDNEAVYLIDWSAQTNAEGYIPIVNANDVTETPSTTFVTYEKDGSGNITLNAPDQAQIGAYQKKVKAAAYKDGDEANGSIQVGSGAYYYIPAFKEYIEDSTCGYTDMQFTVYYRTDSSTSVSTVSGSYDELRIELTAEGSYQFRIVPTNSAGNDMVGIFASGTDDNPRYREAEISSSNVFDAKNLATFEFSVQYNGPTIEKPEDDDDTGYVDATYTVDDFEIIGISDTYTTHYRLYYFEQTDTSRVYTPAELREADENGTLSQIGSWRAINVYDETLDDEDPENDNEYSWNPSSTLSFIPQERGFYKVEVLVSTTNMGVVKEARYIEIVSDADVIPGETYWLENNILSVVFLGVGILCLIGIVVILLIKPKNKAADAASADKAELKEKRKNRK